MSSSSFSSSCLFEPAAENFWSASVSRSLIVFSCFFKDKSKVLKASHCLSNLLDEVKGRMFEPYSEYDYTVSDSTHNHYYRYYLYHYHRHHRHHHHHVHDHYYYFVFISVITFTHDGFLYLTDSCLLCALPTIRPSEIADSSPSVQELLGLCH